MTTKLRRKKLSFSVRMTKKKVYNKLRTLKKERIKIRLIHEQKRNRKKMCIDRKRIKSLNIEETIVLFFFCCQSEYKYASLNITHLTKNHLRKKEKVF